MQAASGLLLLGVTVLALLLMNSSLAPWYDWLRHSHIAFQAGDFKLDKSIHFWINEGLMTIFFFVVGLEIKREILVGELSSPRQAVLPVSAALGGMIAPASIYWALNMNSPWGNGWAIPMATDIAFTLGALTLLGSRVDRSLKVFVAALAIVDDLGAVLVIALFYTTQISMDYLLEAFLLVLALVSFNILGYRRPLPYLLVGALVWWSVFMSGIHSTLAGILVAFTIPARAKHDTETFLKNAYKTLEEFQCPGPCGYSIYTNEGHQEALQRLEKLCRSLGTPLQRIEHVLQPWVIFVIVPAFALINAGIALEWGTVKESLTNSMSLGIVLGLVVGKQVGIMLAAWIAIRARLAVLPTETSYGQLYGSAILCGVGFTMSIFVADLAFGESPALESAKLAILIASLVSLVAGFATLYLASPRLDVENGASNAV